jgi:hypothetical protein
MVTEMVCSQHVSTGGEFRAKKRCKAKNAPPCHHERRRERTEHFLGKTEWNGQRTKTNCAPEGRKRSHKRQAERRHYIAGSANERVIAAEAGEGRKSSNRSRTKLGTSPNTQSDKRTVGGGLPNRHRVAFWPCQELNGNESGAGGHPQSGPVGKRQTRSRTKDDLKYRIR